MKNGFLILVALFIYTGTFSQEIDSRLVRNRGKQAEEAFKYNKNGYNYFLYELDSSYTVKNMSDLSSDEVKLIDKNIQISKKEAQAYFDSCNQGVDEEVTRQMSQGGLRASYQDKYNQPISEDYLDEARS